jgi:tRNA threonylcarbamoyl adenosine modification protein YeaZ
MLVLGIESATAAASAALADETGLKGEFFLHQGLPHSKQLLPVIDALMTQGGFRVGQLDGISVSSGPGSFTGLRIGMALAKGLAQGLDIPIVGISALEALAWQSALGDGLISPMINAFKGEVYAALYRKAGDRLSLVYEPEGVLPQIWKEKLLAFGEQVVLSGNGAGGYAALWESGNDRLVWPSHPMDAPRAAWIAWLGRRKLVQGLSDDLCAMKPAYIRHVEIGRPKERPRLGKGSPP